MYKITKYTLYVSSFVRKPYHVRENPIRTVTVSA